MSNTPVGPGTQVEVRFTLRLPGGNVIDSTGNKSASFVVGDGNLPSGFERAMFGMLAGESAELLIRSEDGFGDHNPENIQCMSRSSFSEDMDLSEGLVVSFADRQKAELPGVISRIDKDEVEVDFNHPLAGRDLLFEVQVIAVEQVSNEIIRV